MVDVFTYLAAYDSPWDSDNKKLYNFYEESGGGDCPMFLSNEEKTSSNSCGNSRMGCWVCTVERFAAWGVSITGWVSIVEA